MCVYDSRPYMRQQPGRRNGALPRGGLIFREILSMTDIFFFLSVLAVPQDCASLHLADDFVVVFVLCVSVGPYLGADARGRLATAPGARDAALASRGQPTQDAGVDFIMDQSQ